MPDTLARRITALSALLLAASSAAGLLIDNLYLEGQATVAMFRGYDLVALLVAVPGLAIVLMPRFASSSAAVLVRAGLLAFVAYDFAYYVFGMAFNRVFLLHVATLGSAVAALGVTVVALRVQTISVPAKGCRVAAALLGVLAASLAIMWISGAIRFALFGTLPDDGNLLVSTIETTHLGYAMDLLVLVPAYFTGAVLLWRRRQWGVVLAAVAFVAGAVTQVTYMAALVFQHRAGVAGSAAFDPLAPLLLAVYAVGSWLLLWRPRRNSDATP